MPWNEQKRKIVLYSQVLKRWTNAECFGHNEELAIAGSGNCLLRSLPSLSFRQALDHMINEPRVPLN